MMLESGLPRSLWGELILTANIFRNLTPTALRNKTPIELWTGRKPSVDRLRKIGCKVYCPIQKQFRGGKFKAVAWEGVLVGYSPKSPDYRVWDPETRNVYKIGGPAFNEDVRPGWWKKESTIKLLIHEQEEDDLEFNDELTSEEAMQPITPPAVSPTRSRHSSPSRSLSLGGEQGEETHQQGSFGPWKFVGAPGVKDVDKNELRVAAPPKSRRSGRENLGVPPVRLGDSILMAITTPDPDAP